MCNKIIIYYAITISVICMQTFGQTQSNTNPTKIEQKQEIQKVIQSYVESNVSTKESAHKQILSIARKSNEDAIEILQQIVLYLSNITNNPGSISLLQVIGEVNTVDPDAVVKAYAPLLDMDSSIRGMTERILRLSVDRGEITKKPYYGLYVEYIKSNQIPPVGLIRYMYKYDPSETITGLASIWLTGKANADEKWNIMLADQIVSRYVWVKRNHYEDRAPVTFMDDALAQLVKLADSERPWVRQYVASLVQLFPVNITKEIVDKLSNDSDSLVKELVKQRQ